MNFFYPAIEKKLINQFDQFEKGAGAHINRWILDHAGLYEVGMSEFIDRNSPNYLSALSTKNMSYFLKGQVTAPIYSTLSKYFNSEKLKDVIAFSALYLGMNPFEAPSIYGLLPYIELRDGLYFPRGGMYKIPQALTRLAIEIGVDIKCNTEVVDLTYDKNKVKSVVLNTGENIDADIIVINADLPFAYKSILKEPHPKQNNFKYSCGAYLIYMGVKDIPKDFYHHQCFLPKSFQHAMQELFIEKKIPQDPAFYTCCPTVTDSSLAPAGSHCLTALVPVPSSPNKIDWSIEKLKLKKNVLEKLNQQGIKEEDIIVSQELTPDDMGVKFNLDQGAAFGLSHKLSQMGPLRPRNKHAKYQNLYFAGASTHPGNGIPMVIKSGKLTAQRIVEEHNLVPLK